jgi:HSP20 family protein
MSVLCYSNYARHYNNHGRANVYTNDDAFIIEIEAPGLSEEDFTINATNNEVSVHAEKEEDELPEESKLLRRERSRGSFTRSFRFRDSLNTEDVSATVSNGLLTLILPKKAARNIPVTSTIIPAVSV